jgi:hypothetical protein
VRELTHVDPELAVLVRERLDAREPRLPARFVPPPERRRRPWVAAAVVIAFALGFGVAVLIRPESGTTVLSGLLGRPVVTTPSAAPGSGGPAAAPSAGQRGAVPTGLPASSAPPAPVTTPAPEASGATGGTSSGGPAPTAAPAPQPSSGVIIQVSLPPLLPTPAPTPTPRPTPTCLISLPPLCVKA